MIISRLQLKNWKNFRKVDVNLRDRVYLIGPNASGKSNFFDALRFLRDIAKTEGGGLQKAVKERGGIKRLRSLLARKDPEISISVELSESADTNPKWRYCLSFRSEGIGAQRVVISKESVEKFDDYGNLTSILFRPDSSDRHDRDQLTQTRLEQISANKEFREISDFFGDFTYLHLVPQLLKYSDQLASYRLENDPFGQAFLERVARTTQKTRDSRLRKIESALKTCVPNMSQLRFVKDDINGTPHLEALYEHWRPDAGWQREDQFSDGTLRLLALMWSLLDGDSLLMLEEPELSLNVEIVRRIHPLIVQIQRQAKYRRQILITTHSQALLENKSIDPNEVIRLEPTADGTIALRVNEEDQKMINSGYSIAEIMLPKAKPKNINQFTLF